jgi:hypothetical protein
MSENNSPEMLNKRGEEVAIQNQMNILQHQE